MIATLAFVTWNLLSGAPAAALVLRAPYMMYHPRCVAQGGRLKTAAFRRPTSRQRTRTTAVAMTKVRGIATDEMTGATDGACKAIFLEHDGKWVSCDKTLGITEQQQNLTKLQLEGLTVSQLRHEARQRGQTVTGSKKDLIQRLFSQEAPVPKRPRRRNHGKPVDTPEGYVERQTTTRPRPLHPYTPQLRVLSWNVNGIRAQMEKEEGRKALQAIIAQERPHVLGLQEIRTSAATSTPPGKTRRKKTPLQTSNFADIVKTILPDYDTVWLSSVPPARQGYAGTALFVRKKHSWDIGCPKLLRVRGGIGHPEGDLEGRVTTAELDVAFVVNVYTPNAGAGLKRLDFRTKDWDQAFAAYVRDLEKIKPVVVVGDMNVAHEDLDFYNPEERRMRKAAGTTPEERSSFAVNLLGCHPPPSCAAAVAVDTIPRPSDKSRGSSSSPLPPSAADDSFRFSAASSGWGEEAGDGGGDGKKAEGSGCSLVDTFREKHPKATGVFSYWSVRARNRPVNRGMRLDYCLASRGLVGGDGVHDAFVLDRDTVGVSDHCPVGLVLRLGDHYPE
ncbi:unnamed protein product [Ectocarpus sp. 12 AP-2014]